MATVKNVFQTGRRTSIDTGADMKATLLTMAVLANALLVACGGGTQAPPGSPPAAEKPSDTALAAKAPPSTLPASVKHIQLEEVDPAEVVILSLQDIDLPADADSVTPSGAISNALLMDGTLRFSTPGDTGEDQEATLEIKSGAATTIGHVLIRSQRLTAAQAYDDGPEDDGLPVPVRPRLIVDGLGPNNTITDAPLAFRLQGVGALDLKDKSKGLVMDKNNNVLGRLEDFWSFNPTDSSFSISVSAMQRLLHTLPSGDLNLGLNFVSKDAEFAVNYDMLVIKQGAKVSGRLQSLNGDPVTTFAGRKILLNGYDARMRAETVVDANGTFTFENVIPDTYLLTWNDLRNPYIVGGSMAIYQDTTQASVTLVVPPNMLAADTSSAGLAAQRAGAGTPLSYVSSYATQDGTPPPPRDIGTTEITP
ncbi:carboxypeptidase-like regulatory domain-containing protein [Verminephrobacter eiseniae]|uniref:carboxypeptidase-like regulatory domain-containing protein n=2 Tax=Verminephrobacter eiseniae TaxID=364317 RepID=UPI0022372344|nr:carboxypeptidase-like regulatory domain-containing protein [Verminephrobacter eiseniae]MCW5231156.1 carboxypeptidase regulatory-like domain-containing protein [Verminephrobacter eiseniae]MCW5292888.1 carboxypeptidase regulatory-like domain-containing protein [Verminephrobacter eiseniae]MCW8185977.1 carboxypeptidase regulatory-like domain-containing protein [Verminephrobacter eiseniae]MCW8235614.1 carboxypeptidase regulatory-like domain-containing protein [Verminephrobacter eiseniae]